jgi:glycosyltransferase involved in cell wall biosynthesis
VRVSIITATFNRRAKLEANFTSVRMQSLFDIEHIIVDNNSTDGTEELVNNYRAGVDFPVLYIRESDNGMYEAMNKGIKAASGEWIHILNSDDRYFCDTSLKSALSINDADEYDLLVFPVEIKNGSTGDSFVFYPEYVKKNKHFRFPHTGIFTRRSFHLRYGYYDERYKTVSDALFGIEHYPKAKYLSVGDHVDRRGFDEIFIRRPRGKAGRASVSS